MGLVLELKFDQCVQVGNTVVTIRACGHKRGRVRLHFEGPDKVTRLNEEGEPFKKIMIKPDLLVHNKEK